MERFSLIVVADELLVVGSEEVTKRALGGCDAVVRPG